MAMHSLLQLYAERSGTGACLVLGYKLERLLRGIPASLGEDYQFLGTPLIMLARVVATVVCKHGFYIAFCGTALVCNAALIGMQVATDFNEEEIKISAKFMVCDTVMLFFPVLQTIMMVAYVVKPDYVQRCYQQINDNLGIMPVSARL